MRGGTLRWTHIHALALTALALGEPAVAADAPPVIPPEMRRTAEALVDKAFVGTRASEWVRGLVDTAGSRLSGSPGDKLAIEWGVATLKRLGFANVRAEKLMAPHWVRGVETGEVVAPYPHKLFLTALGGSVPTPESGLDAEILEVANLEELDAKKPEDVRGKIVFINKRMQRTLDGTGYGKAADVRHRGASRAAKQGAIGVIIRSIGTDSNRTPHTGGMRYLDGIPKIPAAAVSNPDADLLERLGKEGKPVRVRFTLGCRDKGEAETANVIGEVPGRGSPKEIIVLGCHRDAWELGTGAEDDAAGCGIVIEAARLIAGLGSRPRRTIRVVLYANEENGLAGGRKYAADHAAELPLHAAALEADLGSGRPIGFSWNAGPSSIPLMKEISSLLEPLGASALTPDGLGGADISPLVLSGVPLFSVRQEASRYFDLHHTPNDTFDKIDIPSLDKMTAAVAAFAYVAASMKEPFEKIPAEKRKLPEF
jgi:carboxypeptidase Q